MAMRNKGNRIRDFLVIDLFFEGYGMECEKYYIN
jgi:hypothetical protein